MREKLAVVLFVIILAFLGVFAVEVFHKLFVVSDEKFTESASGAFLGAFLAFVFVRFGDFFKSYSDRTLKNHAALVKLEYALNGLLDSLDDNVFVIETFETIYSAHMRQEQKNVFIWANRLHSVQSLNDLIPDLLNIDLINELFTHNIHLRKLNDSMETLNVAYVEAKDALIGGKIDPPNYLANVIRIRTDILNIKSFALQSIEETIQALAAVRVLAKRRPLVGHLLRIVAGRKYDKGFSEKRIAELGLLRTEINSSKREGQKRIDKVMGDGK
jgi:hypothetical protein